MGPMQPADIIARHPDGSYTVRLRMCPCGAVAGECDCNALVAQAANPALAIDHPLPTGGAR